MRVRVRRGNRRDANAGLMPLREQAALLRAAAVGYAVNGDVARARELRRKARLVECRDGICGDRRRAR